MREYLQVYILRILHDLGVFRSLSFMGGTSLRLLYDLPRFSEDLDFALQEAKNYGFLILLKKLRQELQLAGYPISIKYSEEKVVQKAFIKFDGLLFEAGLSPLRNQKFSIKLEVDTHPPQGAVFQTYLVNKYFPISFLSYDLTSLFAGKLGAILTRAYTKGRDFYDLAWFLSRWKDLIPNVIFLETGLKQTGWKGKKITKENWRDLLYQKIHATDWKKVEEDVKNFLEHPTDMKIFTKENVLQMIQSK
jgi:predicted nucleotidyltransferase component of viral defense system